MAYKEPPQGAAAVMLDGGRLQTRAEDGGRGVSAPGWRESKAACCLTLQTKAHGVDPQPEPPSKFLEPTEAARLASEVKRRRRPALGRNDAHREETLTYATNNRERMDDPEYRRLGLPVSSAPVESTIKPINRRAKGSEKLAGPKRSCNCVRPN